MEEKLEQDKGIWLKIFYFAPSISRFLIISMMNLHLMGVFSRKNLPIIKDESNVLNRDDKNIKEAH